MVESVTTNSIATGQSSLITSNITRSVRSTDTKSTGKDKKKAQKLNIGLVGNKSVGKTSLIRKFVKGD